MIVIPCIPVTYVAVETECSISLFVIQSHPPPIVTRKMYEIIEEQGECKDGITRREEKK
jgi:hypothetical protein